MEKTKVSTTAKEITFEAESSTQKSKIEHLFSKNDYGENGFVKDLNADMYRCIAYLYNNTSGMLDHELESWNILDKTGMIHDANVLNRELAQLTQVLMDAGVESLMSIDAEPSVEDPEHMVLKFNFTTGSFVLDSVLQNLT